MEDWPSEAETAVKEMRRADATTIKNLLEVYLPQDRSDCSRVPAQPLGYWGIAVAVVCAELGLPIGFEADSEADVQVYGSEAAVNYWLTLDGFELRDRTNIPADESRSGIFTILNHPVHNVLFEHMYAAHKEVPIGTVMESDPTFYEARVGQDTTVYQITDHEGFQRLYQEDPELCIRLYLTRQLPRLNTIRNSMQLMERIIDLEESSLEESPGTTVESGVITSVQDREEQVQIKRSKLEYWQTDYDFTVSLLLQGYKPYSLEDIIPIARAYAVSLLAVRPELNPADFNIDLPDVRKGIGKLLTELQRRGNADQN